MAITFIENILCLDIKKVSFNLNTLQADSSFKNDIMLIGIVEPSKINNII